MPRKLYGRNPDRMSRGRPRTRLKIIVDDVLKILRGAATLALNHVEYGCVIQEALSLKEA